MASLCTAQELKPIVKHGPGKELGKISQQKARERRIEQLKQQDLDQYTAVANEEELLLGINTDKKKANGFEDYYNGVNIPLKKVSGSDIAPDDFENSFLNKKDY